MRNHHVGVVSGVCLVSLLALTGCEEDQAFYIMQNQVPEQGCIVSTKDDIYRSQGLLDVSLGDGYVMFPLVRNDLPPMKLSNDNSDRPEPNLLQLREYRLSLDLGSIQGAIPDTQLEFRRPTSGNLLPGGVRSSAVEVLPGSLVKQIKLAQGAEPTIIAGVVAVAEDGEGELVESLPFYYPITLCDGCLVRTFSSCSEAEASGLGSNVCALPQDAPLVCCNDGAAGLRCLSGSL